MIRTLFVATFLSSCLLSTASFAMEDFDPHLDGKKMVHIRFEKQGELDQIIKEYKETGKPISLAVACGSLEMPDKIENAFKSDVPAIENWISLDLYRQDCKEDTTTGGPHIRMDANNERHWQEVAHYLEKNEVKIQTVALTICAPWVSDPIIQDTLLPLVQKEGQVIYPECFRTIACFPQFDIDMECNLTSKYGDFHGGGPFVRGLASYHGSKGNCYQNQEALMASTMKWIGEYTSSKLEAENRLAAKNFVNRVISFNLEYLDNGKLRNDKLEELASSQEWDKVKHLFTKTDEQFAEDYFSYFKEYMNELDFDSSSYKIYYSSQERQNVLYKSAEDYVYPKDGTFKLTGYYGQPSLVLIKK